VYTSTHKLFIDTVQHAVAPSAIIRGKINNTAHLLRMADT